MAVHLITGYAGKGHITSADCGCFNAGICGLSKYVLETGEQFKYNLESNNQITISSGDLVNQGRHISIPYGTTETLTIENGSQGYSRIDVVVMRYERAAGTGIETPALKIVKGTPHETTPSVPALETGDIFSGDSVDEMPLYYIYITDLNITEVEKVFTVLPSLISMWNIIYPIGSIYMSVNNVSPSVLFGGTWEKIQDKFLFGSGIKKIGEIGGEETHSLTEDELPLHSHTIPKHSHTIPKHSHRAASSAAGAHNHTVNRSLSAAAGTAKCAAQYGDSHNTSTNGQHSHTITVYDSDELKTNDASEYTSGNSGKGASHNNMPPYITVNIWKRIS